MSSQLDPRIRPLLNDKYYAYTGPGASDIAVGTMEQVETALGIRRPMPVQKKEGKKQSVYTVTIEIQNPAKDAPKQVKYQGITAGSKRDAINQAQRQAETDGILKMENGCIVFSAQKQATQAE